MPANNAGSSFPHPTFLVPSVFIWPPRARQLTPPVRRGATERSNRVSEFVYSKLEAEQTERKVCRPDAKRAGSLVDGQPTKQEACKWPLGCDGGVVGPGSGCCGGNTNGQEKRSAGRRGQSSQRRAEEKLVRKASISPDGRIDSTSSRTVIGSRKDVSWTLRHRLPSRGHLHRVQPQWTGGVELSLEINIRNSLVE